MGSKKLRNRDKPKRSASRSGAVRFLDYEITFDRLDNDNFQSLPNAVRERTAVLHGLIHEEPALAIPELLDLIRQYPDVPVFSNYLHAAYVNTDQQEAAHAVMLDSYHKFPDYLFAKLAYGEFLLSGNNPEEFATLLDHKFDLKLLYPDRTVFHVSEYTIFSALVGQYFCLTGKLETAQILLKGMRQVAPDHPATDMLARQIAHSALQGLIKAMPVK